MSVRQTLVLMDFDEGDERVESIHIWRHCNTRRVHIEVEPEPKQDPDGGIALPPLVSEWLEGVLEDAGVA